VNCGRNRLFHHKGTPAQRREDFEQEVTEV
jgi:hypothetical protein